MSVRPLKSEGPAPAPADWQPLVLAVAPNGARKTKADHPALPIGPEELAETAKACAGAGASMIHLHVRDAEGQHSLDVGRYLAATEAIRAAVGEDLVIQILNTEAQSGYANFLDGFQFPLGQGAGFTLKCHLFGRIPRHYLLHPINQCF